MRQFKNYTTLPANGYLDVAVPSFVVAPLGPIVYAFIQSGLQLRLTKKTGGTADYATVTVTTGGETNIMTVSFRYNDVSYADITELARVGIQKTMATAGQCERGGTAGSITIEEFTAANVSLGTVSMNDVFFIDGLARAHQPASALFATIPDRIILPTGNDFAGYRQAVVRPSAAYGTGSVTVATKLSNGSKDHSVNVPNTSAPVVVEVKDTVAWIDTPQGKVRIEHESCTTDKVFVMWWSSEDGGWKSYLCDILNFSGGVDSRTRYNAGFEHGDTVTGHTVMSARFPLCTYNDWCYVRDILTSGEVRLWSPLTYSAGSLSEMVGVRAVAEGDFGEWRAKDIKDFNIKLIIDELDVL